MQVTRSLTVVTLLAFLTATLPVTAHAQSAPGGATALRASIDRAAASAASAPTPVRRSTPVRRTQTMGGGGGGGGMMLMTLLVTAASLAGTYYMVKELRKSNDEAAKSGQ